jgi:hypothetical protein
VKAHTNFFAKGLKPRDELVSLSLKKWIWAISQT